MEKGYKLCPFCGEEIKEVAIKCKYCGEFLNTDEIDKNEDKSEKFIDVVGLTPWYKKGWIWGIITIFLFFGILVLIGSIRKYRFKQNTNYIYNKIIETNGEFGDEDIDEVLGHTKKIAEEYGDEDIKEFTDSLTKILSDYEKKIDSIDVDPIETIEDFQNASLLKSNIEFRKIYKSYSDEMFTSIDNLYKQIDKNGSTDEMNNEIKKLVKAIDDTADANINARSLLLELQDDFYIGSDGGFYIERNEEKFDEFEQLLDEVDKTSQNYDKAYEEFTEFMVRKAKNKVNK